VVIMGDFNQFVPRIWGSKAASAALEEALGSLTICTEGVIHGVDRPTVDHIALSANLRPLSIVGIDEHDDNGRKLSDHFGLAVRVSIG
jgi:endonuclease/exonuclease/phosphatase family metal-dependent hydrolase